MDCEVRKSYGVMPERVIDGREQEKIGRRLKKLIKGSLEKQSQSKRPMRDPFHFYLC